MTNIEFIKQNDFYMGVLCEGHTGYANYGKDIVCASVSSIVGALNIGITKSLGINANVKIDDKRGYMEIRLPKKINEAKLKECQLLFQTAYLALSDLQSGYPDNVNVEVKSL